MAPFLQHGRQSRGHSHHCSSQHTGRVEAGMATAPWAGGMCPVLILKGIQTGKQETKIPLFVESMIINAEKLK